MTDLIIVIEYNAIFFCIRIVQDLFTRRIYLDLGSNLEKVSHVNLFGA